MTILLTSGNPLGLRAVGSGGRTAVSSYEQITRTLRQMFGPAHAALFAEPSQRAAAIDWYGDVEARGKPVRLSEAPPGIRDPGLERLERLVRDIEAKAVSLQKSDRQDERILGDMLAHALEIPDEDAVFLVGDQPVMTFWGYVKDQSRPAVSPMHMLLRRRSPPPPPPDAPPPIVPPAPSRPAPAPAAAIGPPPAEPVPPPPVRAYGTWLPPAALWVVFTLLLVTCGVELLRGCAIGFPHGLTGWLLNACPAAGSGDSGAVADERARQAEFQAQYDELIREAALSRQACVITQHKNEEPVVQPVPEPAPEPVPKPEPEPVPVPPAPEPIPVPPAPEPQPDPATQDQMKLPPANDDKTDFLEGCWRAQDTLTEITDGKNTGRKLKATYCFNRDGTGTRTIRYEQDNAKCVGPLKAQWQGDLLTIDIADAPCEANHGHFVPAVAKCRRGQGGEARCDQVPNGSKKPEFSDFPFTRTNEQP